MRTLRKAALGFLLVLCATTSLCLGAALPLPQSPVIFIHGLGSDADTWNDLRGFFINHGWTNGGSPQFVKSTYATNDYVTGVGAGTFYTMNMSDHANALFKSQNLSFSQQGYEVAKAVEKVRQVTGQPKVILVGHSMGGLAARAYVEGQAQWDDFRAMAYSNDVEKVITIGTPHQGSPLVSILLNWPPASTVAFLGGLSAGSVAVQSLEANSPALAFLNSGSLPPDPKYVSVIAAGVPIMLYPDAMGDGVVPYQSQNLGMLPIANGRIHTARELMIFPKDFISRYQTHSYETSDLQVWDELIRQLSTASGLPGDLKLNMAANPNPVRPGEPINYVMTVVNQGTNDR